MMSGYSAVRDGGAGLIDLSASRGRIRVGGSEAVMFLNGLISNDMKTLEENRWMPATFPNVQGRLIGAVRVARLKDSFLIETDAASHEAVLKTISRFTLAGDFKVTDITSETRQLRIQGGRAKEIVEKEFGPLDLQRNGLIETENHVIIIHTAEDRFDLVSDSASLFDTLCHAGAACVSDDEAEILRVEEGTARHGRDMDETNVVLETNLDDAISYTKGCYLGQEIIIRIQHRGHVAKKLTGLRFETNDKIGAGMIIKSGDKEIGRVTSAVVSPKLGTSIALGYVRYEYLAPGTEVLVDDRFKATVSELPFIR